MSDKDSCILLAEQIVELREEKEAGIRIISKLQTRLDAATTQIADLEEALRPFALYASLFEGRDDIMTPVAESGNQALIIGAFQHARETLKPE